MSSADIKLIDKDTDLSQVNMSKLDWDIEVHNRPHDVYRLEGFIHSIGGHWGENEYWCCPRGEKPTYDNLMEFNGHVVQWGIEYIPSNYTKCKWNQTSVRKNGKAVIKRNGKVFYTIGAREHEYALAKSQVALSQIQEHPICFHDQNYLEELKGRKIWYNGQPAIIDHPILCEEYGLEVWVVPDKECIPKFRFPSWENTEEEGWIAEYDEGCKCDILESNIDWFRESK